MTPITVFAIAIASAIVVGLLRQASHGSAVASPARAPYFGVRRAPRLVRVPGTPVEEAKAA